jgi:hypothetical protein
MSKVKSQNHNLKLKTFAVLAVIFGFSFLVFSLNPSRARAQEAIPLTVAPARQQLNIDPGATQTLEIKFFNRANLPLAGNLKVVDFIVKDSEGSPLFLENQELSNRFAAANWVKLPFEKATIAAGDVLKIQFKVEAPEDARPGGRYIAIYFEPVGTIPVVSTLDKEGLQATTSRIVGLVYIRVNGPITESAIVKRFDVPEFVEYGPIKATAEILNRGDYHIAPTGQITLYNWLGKKVDEKTLKQKNIFPDASRIYKASLGSKLLIGKYKLVFSASYGEQGKALVAQAFVWAFPVKAALIIILTIIILILGTILLWKKLKQRQVKLEEKLEEEIEEIEKLKEKYKDKLPS